MTFQRLSMWAADAKLRMRLMAVLVGDAKGGSKEVTQKPWFQRLNVLPPTRSIPGRCPHFCHLLSHFPRRPFYPQPNTSSAQRGETGIVR